MKPSSKQQAPLYLLILLPALYLVPFTTMLAIAITIINTAQTPKYTSKALIRFEPSTPELYETVYEREVTYVEQYCRDTVRSTFSEKDRKQVVEGHFSLSEKPMVASIGLTTTSRRSAVELSNFLARLYQGYLLQQPDIKEVEFFRRALPAPQHVYTRDVRKLVYASAGGMAAGFALSFVLAAIIWWFKRPKS